MEKCIFHIWIKRADSITWSRSQASPWPFCHIMIHPFGRKPLRTGPQGAYWDQVSPERVLGRFHPCRHCSGFLVPSIIRGEWEISPSHSLSNIGMREGKSQCFSHIVFYADYTRKYSKAFQTQGRPFLRHHSLNFQFNFRVLTSDPKCNSNFEHPLSVLTCLFICPMYFYVSQYPMLGLGRKHFFCSRYSNVRYISMSEFSPVYLTTAVTTWSSFSFSDEFIPLIVKGSFPKL